MLICLLLSMPFAGMILIYTTLFQASGKALPAFILSIFRQYVIAVVVIMERFCRYNIDNNGLYHV